MARSDSTETITEQLRAITIPILRIKCLHARDYILIRNYYYHGAAVAAFVAIITVIAVARYIIRAGR